MIPPSTHFNSQAEMVFKEIGVTMTYQTINEERGAQKAAELRRRFQKASGNTNPISGFGPAKFDALKSGFGSRRDYFNAFLIWITMAAVIVFFGFMLF